MPPRCIGLSPSTGTSSFVQEPIGTPSLWTDPWLAGKWSDRVDFSKVWIWSSEKVLISNLFSDHWFAIFSEVIMGPLKKRTPVTVKQKQNIEAADFSPERCRKNVNQPLTGGWLYFSLFFAVSWVCLFTFSLSCLLFTFPVYICLTVTNLTWMLDRSGAPGPPSFGFFLALFLSLPK